jgi:undecaprenyl-diphosphatase
MDPYFVLLLKAVILGVVEGATEFLPVSSTGHLILVGQALKFQPDLAVTFEVFIQLGAILAVVWLFRADLWSRLVRLPTDPPGRHFALVVFIAFLPAAVIGLLTANWIETHLFAPLPVAVAQIVGALFIFLAESRNRLARTFAIDDVSTHQGLVIGGVQVASLWPGMSRAGASILGGMFAGLDRATATRFSFYLAIPTVGAASLYALAKHWSQLHAGDLLVLAVGFVVSFAVALVVIQALLRFVTRHTLRVFAWYRIIIGLLVLALIAAGIMPR